MLSPNIIAVTDNLTQAYLTIRQTDAFAYASIGTSIEKLSPDPEWLGLIRSQLKLLSNAGAQWQQKKPDIWSPILSQFPNYSTLISSIADVVHDLKNNKELWLKFLYQLSDSLEISKNLTKTSEEQFILQIKKLKNIQQVFNTTLDEAWDTLANEEQEMNDLAIQVTTLQDKVSSLEANLTSSEISGGKNFIQSTAKISYTLVSSVEFSIPYLTVASLAYTVGQTLFDIIATDKEIGETLSKIVKLQTQLSEEAQAMVMIKAIIQLINNFDITIAKINYQFPTISTMWANEKTKVDQAISAIQAGAIPEQMIELVSIPVAAKTWTNLTDFVLKLQQNIEQGKHVAITTSRPSSTNLEMAKMLEVGLSSVIESV